MRTQYFISVSRDTTTDCCCTVYPLFTSYHEEKLKSFICTDNIITPLVNNSGSLHLCVRKALKTSKIFVTAEVSSLMRLTNDAFCIQIQDTSFRQKCLRLRCHDFSALAD